jgi:small subunit ribosomal protein S16
VAVRLRLTRVGSRKNPIWRVVAADGRAKRDGRVLETLGRYNPQRQPSEIVLDRDRIDHWLARGAQPSETVRKLILASERGAPPARATTSARDRSRAGGRATDSGTAAEAEASADGAQESAASEYVVTADELTGDPAAEDESASVAEAAPADEVGAPGEFEG